MKRWISALMAALIAVGGLVVAQGQAQDGLATVTVQITGFKGTEGMALVTLYNGADTWLNIPKALQVVKTKITGPNITVEFKGVKPGTYAVQVVHDANKNNELDMRWLPWPKPKEGTGASNDPDTKAGPPKFDQAKFNLGAEGTTVKATVKYAE
jgi:uncharacterized protein (DUF2141 family)